jgi:hypothetical protein
LALVGIQLLLLVARGAGFDAGGELAALEPRGMGVGQIVGHHVLLGEDVHHAARGGIKPVDHGSSTAS